MASPRIAAFLCGIVLFTGAPHSAGLGREARAQGSGAAEESAKTEALAAEFSAQVGAPRPLAELVELALERAPGVREARARLGLGEAALEGAGRLIPFNPQLNATLGAGVEDGGLARLEVTLTQQLEIAGERGARLEAARAQRAALRAELARAAWGARQRLRRSYRLAQVTRRRVDVEGEVARFTEELLRIAELRFEAGEEARTSVIVARAEMARARQRLVGAWGDHVREVRALGEAIGWGEVAPPGPEGAPPAPRALPGTEELVDRARRGDPESAAIAARLDQALAELALAEREAWPSPTLGLGFERESPDAADIEDRFLFVIALPLPAWDRNQGGIAEARARIAIERQALGVRRTIIEGRVREQAALVAAARRGARIFSDEVLPALEDQLALLQRGFELGELGLLDVMNARDRLLDVQRQYLDALREYFAALGDLEAVLGSPVWSDKEEER